MEKENLQSETVKNCPILYQMADKPMTETCMCWGWEFDNGWDEIVSNASYELEAINLLFYPKYRIRIQADQIKQKFGALCFYYSVITDKTPVKAWMSDLLISISGFVRKFVKSERISSFLCKRIYGLESILCGDYGEQTPEQMAISHLVESLAKGIIRKAERECDNTCEHCGASVRTSWSPACITKGWISVLCEECAKKSGEEYEIENAEVKQ